MTVASEFGGYCGAPGRDLISSVLAGEANAGETFSRLVEAVMAGDLDGLLNGALEPGAVYVTTSCHALVLALMRRHNGMTSAEFYKGDAERYVRLNLFVQRLLGLRRLTIGQPVYAFGAEALGQTMMYPEDQAPGSDPGVPLVTLDGWRDIPAFDPDNQIVRLIRDSLLATGRLAGIEPVAHLPGPYSLAAEILGQETLIAALLEAPDKVKIFLGHLVETVLAPWCADLYATVPDVWLELSDASGSPMFIGPANFHAIAVDPVRRMIEDYPWGHRLFVANYRGDSPPGRARGGRGRRQAEQRASLSFEELLEAKLACCPQFLIRLEADSAPVAAYREAAIQHALPLYLGIGAVLLDRNSVPDAQSALSELFEMARTRAEAIRDVRTVIGLADDASWPGDLYIEDTNGETNFDLFAAVLEGCEAR